MTQMDSLWERILDQSLIMKSAIEAGDFDIFEKALDERKKMIEALGQLTITDEVAFSSYLDQFEKIESIALEHMDQFEDTLKNEFLNNRKKQHEMVRNKQVHDRYQMSGEPSGLSMDRKK